jgi:biopolymer transport protein ExbD
MTVARKSLLPPRQQTRMRFVLTPLADAMFQLLIFFMLSSNLSPYSLLTIRSGDATANSGTDQGNGDVATAQPIGPDVAIWSVEDGAIVANGQRFELALLPDLAAALTAAGTGSIVVVVRPAAHVQDLAAVLEALAFAGITAVQLAATETT